MWGSQVGYDTITIVVKEFWPDIHRKLSKKHKIEAVATLTPKFENGYCGNRLVGGWVVCGRSARTTAAGMATLREVCAHVASVTT